MYLLITLVKEKAQVLYLWLLTETNQFFFPSSFKLGVKHLPWMLY